MGESITGRLQREGLLPGGEDEKPAEKPQAGDTATSEPPQSETETPEPQILNLDGRQVDVTGWNEAAVAELKRQDEHHRKVQADRDRARQHEERIEREYQKKFDAFKADMEAKLAQAAPKEPAKPTVTAYDRMIADATGQEPEDVAAARQAATPKDDTAEALKAELAELKKANAAREARQKLTQEWRERASGLYHTVAGFDSRITQEVFAETYFNSVKEILSNPDLREEWGGLQAEAARYELAGLVATNIRNELNAQAKISNQTPGHQDEPANPASNGVGGGAQKTVSKQKAPAPTSSGRAHASAPAAPSRNGAFKPDPNLSVDEATRRYEQRFGA